MPDLQDQIRTYSSSKLWRDNGVAFAPAPAPPQRDSMMDLDLDGQWSFDQIFTSNPLSPFFFSSSEQPYSPLWAFSDVNDDDKLVENDASTLAADYPDSLMDNQAGNCERRKQPTPLLALTPPDYPDSSCLLKERMTQALRHFKDSTEQHVLAQVWAPVKNGGRYVLTTSEQPFFLDPNSHGLYQYRTVSLRYLFSVDDGESDVDLGLPGRVFRQKMPEWTPNVQYYSSKEYTRLNHALFYNVRGTLALPVFEPSGQRCIGVLELIMTSQKINYAPEVDKVCKALEAVNLKSSDILEHPETQISNEGRQNALAEILEILAAVCEEHKLPLAQTWVPCMHRSVITDGGGFKKSCRSFDGSCIGRICMSTTDAAFYVVDASMWGFREACAEHHLQKGQGVVGRAFASHNACFCEDITKFRKNEYPLVHYARMFRLTSLFAICLRSSHTGNDEYIVEFFLPLDMRDSRDQQKLLNSILLTMKRHFKSLKVASGKELEEAGRFIEIIRAPLDERNDSELESFQMSPPCPPADPFKKEEQQKQLVNVGIQPDVVFPVNKVTTKKSERKRGKAEKSISLDVLQQYFAGSLKDAAKSLGVCPTTMKRICRQHGISRWPSRKINKVNRSLSKLKRVIESVQGADATFTLNSLATTNPVPISVGSLSWTASALDESTHQLKSSTLNEPVTLTNAGTTINETPIVNNNLILVDPRSFRLEEVPDDSSRSKSASGSRDESTGTPTSQGSCQGTPQSDPAMSPINEKLLNLGSGSIEPTLFHQQHPTGKIDLSSAFTIPNTNTNTNTNAISQLLAQDSQEPFGAMLIEDAGSSHDLRNLCNGTDDLTPLEPVMARMLQSSQPEGTTVTIKATYKEDIIRFRFHSGCGILKLREEVGKRLKLNVGTFDIKYLDDDQEWVLIACDADLCECLDISKDSGSNIIRLLIQDITANFGSSCESSGDKDEFRLL